MMLSSGYVVCPSAARKRNSHTSFQVSLACKVTEFRLPRKKDSQQYSVKVPVGSWCCGRGSVEYLAEILKGVNRLESLETENFCDLYCNGQVLWDNEALVYALSIAELPQVTSQCLDFRTWSCCICLCWWYIACVSWLAVLNVDTFFSLGWVHRVGDCSQWDNTATRPAGQNNGGCLCTVLITRFSGEGPAKTQGKNRAQVGRRACMGLVWLVYGTEVCGRRGEGCPTYVRPGLRGAQGWMVSSTTGGVARHLGGGRWDLSCCLVAQILDTTRCPSLSESYTLQQKKHPWVLAVWPLKIWVYTIFHCIYCWHCITSILIKSQRNSLQIAFSKSQN